MKTMSGLEIISAGIRVVSRAYYKFQIRMLSEKLELTPRFSFDYPIRKQRLQKYLNKYYDLTHGTKTR